MDRVSWVSERLKTGIWRTLYAPFFGARVRVPQKRCWAESLVKKRVRATKQASGRHGPAHVRFVVSVARRVATWQGDQTQGKSGRGPRGPSTGLAWA